MMFNNSNKYAMAKRKLSEVDEAFLPINIEALKSVVTKQSQVGRHEFRPSFVHLATRLPSLQEFVTFVAWVACFLTIYIQECLLWVIFFTKVVDADNDKTRFLNFLMWSVWLGVVVALRYSARARSGDMRAIFDHAELFILVSMIMVIIQNIGFTYHTPGATLFDIGFYFIPALPAKSALSILGEVMTISLPISCALLTVFQTPENRIKSFCDYFRLMTIAYGLRAMTIALTSLPGPASHCKLDSGMYHPPTNWIEVVTQLAGMYGAGKTCGDLIFSGHTSVTLTAIYLLGRKLDFYWGYSALRWACLFIYESTILLVIIAGRKHYSIDIMVAVIIVTFAFKVFGYSWQPMPRRDLDSFSVTEIAEYLAQKTASMGDNSLIMLEPQEDMFAKTNDSFAVAGELIC